MLGVERFAGDGGGVALVVLDHRSDVDGRRHRRAVGLGVGNEFADGHVGALEIVERDALHVGGGDARDSGRAAGRRAASRRARRTRKCATPNFCGLDITSSKYFAALARTRATSASVIGSFLTFSIVANIASRAGVDRIAVRESAPKTSASRVVLRFLPDSPRASLSWCRPATCTGGRTGAIVRMLAERIGGDVVRMRAAHRVEHHRRGTSSCRRGAASRRARRPAPGRRV